MTMDLTRLELAVWRALATAADLDAWLATVGAALTELAAVPRLVARVDRAEASPALRRAVGVAAAPVAVVEVAEGDRDEFGRAVVVVAGPDGGEVLAVGLAGPHGEAELVSLGRALAGPWRVVWQRERMAGRLDEVESLLSGSGSLRARAVVEEHVVIGGQRCLAQVMARVRMVARSDAAVLLLGETGSGKEVIARAIHTASGRAGGPFVRVNCGAVPAELLDSHLFGHERGSFTGAHARHVGWFERADRGTLLLDEVGELPLAAQVRLLRVIQEGEFERVGGREAVRVDCRLVTSTHRDLPSLVQDGLFREDLWYRISTFPILIPPLRERLADIPELAAHFARRSALRHGLRPCQPTPADLALLEAYRWPGNIRELASVMDRAVLLGEGRLLKVDDALGLSLSASSGAVGAARPGAVAPASAEAVVSFAAAVRRHLERALVATGGRVDGARGAARLLGLKASTLRSKLARHGLDPADFRS